MTQYKFRGQQVGTGKWVYGSLLSCEDSFGPIYHIMVQHKFPFEREHFLVRGETVGMWTGRKDKNGTDLFTGDVVDKGRGEIYWDEQHLQFRVRFHNEVFKKVRGGLGEMLFANSQIVWEVIGNVHDHPHLLTPSQKCDVLNTMNTDPNLQPAAPANQEAIAEQVQATEQEAQENAMESTEEGGAEG